MPGRLQLEVEQAHREEDQRHADPAHRELPERHEGEQQRDHANDARAKHPGTEELGHQRHAPEREQQIGDVRVCDHPQEAFQHRRSDRADLRARRAHDDGPVSGLGRASIELVQQIAHVRGDQVDDPEINGLARGVGPGVGDGVLQCVGVAVPLLRDSPDERPGVLVHLLPQRRGQILARAAHGRRGADVRRWRHGREVGRHRDERSGRRRLRARRRDVDGEGRPGTEDRLDHVAHGVDAPPGRVQLDHHERRTVVGRLVDRACEVARADRIDHAVDLHQGDVIAFGVCANGPVRESECEQPQRQERQADSARSPLRHAVTSLPQLERLRGGNSGPERRWSGRWDSNPRPSAWEADALPLSYSRIAAPAGAH